MFVGVKWATILSAVALAGAVATTAVVSGGDGGGGDGSANLWVESGAGTCTRSATTVTYEDSASPDARCGTLDQAYDAANASSSASTVEIVAGTYGEQDITGSRSSTNRIVMELDGAVFSTGVTFGIYPPDGSAPAQGPDYLTLRDLETGTFPQDGQTNQYGISVYAGSSFLRFEDADQGGFFVGSSHDIEFIGGDFGPCRAPPLPDWGGNTEGSCELNKADHMACEGFHADCQPPENITLEGVFVHDYDIGPLCQIQAEDGPDGCHHRALYWNGVKGGVIRGNTFKNVVFQPWTTHSGPDAGASGTEDLLVENNSFSYSASPAPSEFGFALAWCQNASNAYRDVTIRFNSFAEGTELGLPDTVTSGGTCSVSNLKVYGNIVEKSPSCQVSGPGTNSGTITWAYNVLSGPNSGSCGTGDVRADGTNPSHPFYTEDTQQPDPGDFALAGATAAPDNLVPADDSDFPCPATDAAGNPRPAGAGEFCDAGAYERQ